MTDELLLAGSTGLIAILGIIIGAALSQFNSYLEHKRTIEREFLQGQERERAVFHGAYALCNFINEKLNEWDSSKNVFALERLSVVQPYLGTLIDRSPRDSDRLMVSLFDLGIRLESLLFAAGFAAGSVEDLSSAELETVQRYSDDLARAAELVQILVTGELPMVDLEEFDVAESAEEAPNPEGEKE
ncbi:hypothetical protein [Pontixanthobacter sp. CEM42]|uniref:hypothetical protein n=1 Tax=Pontixanthobacter sp. CEM42 TaxID=2792077 RepID=UPI001ADFE43F|nr:hypothetical protein [Pontixanthobacter sp. CEM42]